MTMADCFEEVVDELAFLRRRYAVFMCVLGARSSHRRQDVTQSLTIEFTGIF